MDCEKESFRSSLKSTAQARALCGLLWKKAEVCSLCNVISYLNKSWLKS